MAYEFKNIKILGYTTDFNQCDCCGKSDLKGTISILDLNTDVVLHFGTTCAAKSDKYDDLDAFNRAKKEISSIKRTVEDSINFAWHMCRKMKIKTSPLIVANDYVKFIQDKERDYLKAFDWKAY